MRTIIISLFESPLRRCYSAKWRSPFATKHEPALTLLRRFILPALAVGLFFAVTVQDKVGLVQAQVGSSISADGSAPNNNAMLDVQSPASGDGKGILIPRVTLVQRTTASSTEAGGLLDNSGNLRGGAAQGLIVYQTDGTQGLYFNTSQSATPAWAYLGDVTGLLASNVWAAAGSTTNYLPRTGGTMSGALNMGAQTVTNVAHIDFNGNDVSVGAGANGSSDGAAVGASANGSLEGSAMGYQANGYRGVAIGYQAKGADFGAVVGRLAIGTNYGATVGNSANGSVEGVAAGFAANGYNKGAAIGRSANGSTEGAAMGYEASGTNYGAAVGRDANGSSYGAAVGYNANGSYYGAAVGYLANGSDYGVALGRQAIGTNYGAAVGYNANGSSDGAALGRVAIGSDNGVAIGFSADGNDFGAAVGYMANGVDFGAAMGRSANGARTNVAIGRFADANGGTERIAIGNSVNNVSNNTAWIRGTLHLDGGSSNIYSRTNFGSGGWTAKAFEINHPLDPENKILRHFCLEGPQVWNVYAGNAQLVNGQAVVQLPDYYSALNLAGSEIYCLTPISSDRQATAVIEQEVIDNCFVIGGSSDMKVSWTIKVLRNDPGCREDLRRRPVEQMKREISNRRTAEQ